MLGQIILRIKFERLTKSHRFIESIVCWRKSYEKFLWNEFCVGMVKIEYLYFEEQSKIGSPIGNRVIWAGELIEVGSVLFEKFERRAQVRFVGFSPHQVRSVATKLISEFPILRCLLSLTLEQHGFWLQNAQTVLYSSPQNQLRIMQLQIWMLQNAFEIIKLKHSFEFSKLYFPVHRVKQEMDKSRVPRENVGEKWKARMYIAENAVSHIWVENRVFATTTPFFICSKLCT